MMIDGQRRTCLDYEMTERTFLKPNHPLVWIMATLGFIASAALGTIIDGIINFIIWYFLSSIVINFAWRAHKRMPNTITKLLFPKD